MKRSKIIFCCLLATICLALASCGDSAKPQDAECQVQEEPTNSTQEESISSTDPANDASAQGASESEPMKEREGGIYFQEESYDSIDAAIEAFTQGIAENDLQKSLSACSFQSKAAGFDFDNYVGRIGVYTATLKVPSDQSLYAQINAVDELSTQTNQIKLFTMSLLVSEEQQEKYLKFTPAKLSENEDMVAFEAFTAKIRDTPRLEALRVEAIVGLEQALSGDVLAILENAQRNFNRNAEMYGADEATEKLVIYELDGEYFLGGFGMIRYGDDWKISYLNSILAGQPSSGVATLVSNEEMEWFRSNGYPE